MFCLSRNQNNVSSGATCFAVGIRIIMCGVEQHVLLSESECVEWSNMLCCRNQNNVCSGATCFAVGIRIMWSGATCFAVGIRIMCGVEQHVLLSESE